MGRRGRLCSRLASVLARHPSLLRDLPALLLSIDRGNATPISHLDSRSQRALVSLLETLPVREVEVDDQRRWVREGKESLVGVVLAAMTDKRLIRDENRLLPSERMATEVLERLLPHLGDNNRDVKGVLQDLAGIGSASLPQSPENNWVTGLSDAAVSIGLQRCDGTLTIPSDETTELTNQWRECFEMLSSCLSDEIDPPSSPEKVPLEQHLPVLGPSRPTAEEAAMLTSIDADSDDDFMGPLPADAYRSAPIPMASSKQLDDVHAKQASSEPVREEWMLSPGNRDPFSGGIVLSTTFYGIIHYNPAPTEKFGKNRQFQSGKTAKKTAEALAALKEKNSTPEALAQAEQTQQVLDEYRALRGPSLMDMHSEKKAQGKPETRSRQPFDRERVLAGVFAFFELSFYVGHPGAT